MFYVFFLFFFKEKSQKSLSEKYRQSQLYKIMKEELEHINKSIENDGVDKEKAGYATSFLYQVSKHKFKRVDK